LLISEVLILLDGDEEEATVVVEANVFRLHLSKAPCGAVTVGVGTGDDSIDVVVVQVVVVVADVEGAENDARPTLNLFSNKSRYLRAAGSSLNCSKDPDVAFTLITLPASAERFRRARAAGLRTNFFGAATEAHVVFGPVGVAADEYGILGEIDEDAFSLLLFVDVQLFFFETTIDDFSGFPGPNSTKPVLF